MLIFFFSSGPAAYPISSESQDLTAAMGSTLAAIPGNTPPPWATIMPAPGDLGWGSLYGRIVDGATMLPLAGATLTCEHASTSPYPCMGTVTTNSDGMYVFANVYFLGADRITLLVEAPGYTPLHFEQNVVTQIDFHLDLGLFPGADGIPSPTPIIMCTAPACNDGLLSCGNPDGCPGGCGYVCVVYTSIP